MKKTNLKKAIFFIIGGAFIAAATFVIVEVASSGAVLAKLDSEKALLVAANQALSDELVKASSLTTLEKNAENLGFIKPGKTLYISESDAITRLP